MFILGDGTAGGASPREGGRCQRWPPPSRLRAPPFLGQGFPCACARKRIVDARIHECGGGRCYLKRLGFFCCLAGPALEHECICESMKRKRKHVWKSFFNVGSVTSEVSVRSRSGTAFLSSRRPAFSVFLFLAFKAYAYLLTCSFVFLDSLTCLGKEWRRTLSPVSKAASIECFLGDCHASVGSFLPTLRVCQINARSSFVWVLATTQRRVSSEQISCSF